MNLKYVVFQVSVQFFISEKTGLFITYLMVGWKCMHISVKMGSLFVETELFK